ncbi:hypothetical protein [Allorhizocola rhizosphaerae]|uniref:hypothetical protein n=1 Tax=Allorhizocola rhizosphaerae TaxID=1872709 RepID=UPI000E3B8D2F|nr:hypothetical protein [Allorhizocola rhizosphaerae]
MTRLLVIMGSGETTPTMIKPHRRIFESLPVESGAVMLDTPYGFQLNADEISARAVGYFAQSVGRDIEVVSWRTPPDQALERERALTAIRSAGWVFAGPGSPTYALRQWRDTEIPALLTKAEALVFASAAALTLGSHCIPVYEIYKAGISPHWEPGLDIFRELTGVPAVVIPHYDNAEGGHHDTRYCYLGEPRLSYLERQLPPETLIVGVDEHTALVCDLDAGTASVVGNGGLTLRRNGLSTRFATGAVLPLTLDAPSGTATPVSAPASAPPSAGQGVAAWAHAASLRVAADELEAHFMLALSNRDFDGCVAATLELEQIIADWSGDTLTSDDGDHARGLLRSMIVRLGTLAVDPATVLAPLVDRMLALRTQARAERDFTTSDRVRDLLIAAGIEVRDTPDGTTWSLTA